jgi:hypothetical protein
MVDVATFCGNCGSPSTGEERYCSKCGHAAYQVTTESTSEAPAASRLELQDGHTGPVFRQQATNGLAIASLVLGIVWLWWLGSILALVFGYIARRQIARSNHEQTGRGLATAGIVLGWVGIGLPILAGILVFAVGNLTTTGANKTSACSAEKTTIGTALEAYKAATGAYPASIGFLDGVGQTPPASVGVLLKTAPPDYTIDANGSITAIPNNPGDCT